MLNAVLFLAIVLGGAAIVFFAAGDLNGHGSSWATEVCTTGRFFCDHPAWVEMSAAATAGLFVVMKLVSVLRA